MRRAAAATVAVVLAGVLALMVRDARGGDWPGWDEGWALVLFPLGIPAAVAAGLALARTDRLARATTAVTAAVWCWGALLFALWHVAG